MMGGYIEKKRSMARAPLQYAEWMSVKNVGFVQTYWRSDIL